SCGVCKRSCVVLVFLWRVLVFPVWFGSNVFLCVLFLCVLFLCVCVPVGVVPCSCVLFLCVLFLCVSFLCVCKRSRVCVSVPVRVVPMRWDLPLPLPLRRGVSGSQSALCLTDRPSDRNTSQPGERVRGLRRTCRGKEFVSLDLGTGEGSAIAKIIGHNVKASNRFEPLVNMWVFEETVSGRKLTEIINTEHENVKYLPGHKLPKNVIAVPDVAEAVAGADILVFVIPHQFIGKLCDQMKPRIKPEAIGISLIKGIDEGPEGLTLISDIIRNKLEIDVSVLMGANIANEVADEKFCETTIGTHENTQEHTRT
ncbi:hypothetical protein NFI96_031391, partial [Prochilodus magdalenae]